MSVAIGDVHHHHHGPAHPPHVTEYASASPIAMVGRIYQNPQQRNEIWANFGWSQNGLPHFPPYHTALAPWVSEEQYNAIFDALQEDMMEKGPTGSGSPTCVLCAMLWCPCTCGLTCCYFHHLREEYLARLAAIILRAGDRLECRVHFHLAEGFNLPVPGQADWIDSAGLPLVLSGPHSAAPVYPGGPPIGYNIVFTFAQPLQPWPPEGVSRVPYSLLFAPGAMSMGSHGAFGIHNGAHPPPYSAGGVTVATAVSAPGAVATATAVPVNLHYCKHCGTRTISAGDVFCSVCGGNQNSSQPPEQPPAPGEANVGK